MAKFAVALLVVMMAASYALAGHGGYGGGGGGGGGWGQDYYSHPKYKYSYGVNDGWTKDQKTASEWRDGDNVAGSYALREPDGSWRHVTYWADKGGFRANVHRTPNHHPHGHGHGHGYQG